MAKDILLAIDDYASPADANSAREINKTVEYMIRDIGNRQGRVRSNADMSSQTTYYPRGLVVTSGEQVPPPGVSRSARILPIPIRKEDFFAEDDLTLSLLTQAQKDRFYYPVAMCHYIKWIEDHWDDVKSEFNNQYEHYRSMAPKQDVHLRMVEIVLLLQTGLYIATEYAVQKGGLDNSSRQALLKDGWKILTGLVNAQNARVANERPGERFIECLKSMLASGKVTLRLKDDGGRWIHSGPSTGQDIIGWDDMAYPFIYVNPSPAYSAVFNFCQRTGEYFGSHRDETWKDLQIWAIYTRSEMTLLRPLNMWMDRQSVCWSLKGQFYFPRLKMMICLQNKAYTLFACKNVRLKLTHT